jgi:phosphonate degradation associated HDIG domain protein
MSIISSSRENGLASSGVSPKQITAQIEALLLARGDADYIGEPVSQSQHFLQSAFFAEQAGADEELILAALLHDIGHVLEGYDEAQDMAGLGRKHHEAVGADFLRNLGFSQRVASLVENHVNAKRYLCTKNPEYAALLSPASKRTLNFQGGTMTGAEAESFESDPLHEEYLLLRRWDEAAKQETLKTPPLKHYLSIVDQHLQTQREKEIDSAITPFHDFPTLTAEQLSSWHRNGYLKLSATSNSSFTSTLSHWVDELQDLPETAGKWMQYFEAPEDDPHGRQLCRIENFLQFHPQLDALLRSRPILALVSQLMGDRAVLFKEKINFKLPGGNGFAPHQDAPAFTSFGQSYHITLMLSVDASTEDNGCLELVPGNYLRETLPLEADSTLNRETASTLAWEPLTTQPGDILLFDSFIPHRSGPNRSQSSRRALYVTYGKAAEGSYREAYYRLKRATFPPDIERIEGQDYGDTGVFNVGNPIRA